MSWADRYKTIMARALMLAILLGAWAWRLAGITSQSLWRDEVDSLRFATRPLSQALGAFTRPGENGPLYYLLLRPWLDAAGRSEFALRFPSILLGVLAVALIYPWGRYLYGRKMGAWGGLLAALLLAVNPYHVWYSQEARMYALIVVIILLSLWTFKEGVERGGWRPWALWYVFTSLGFYIHVLAVLALPLQALWMLLIPTWRRRWPQVLAAFALLILPYLPLIGWQWTLLTDINFRTGHPFYPFGKFFATLFTVQIQGLLSASKWSLAPPIFLLMGAFLLPPVRKKRLAMLSSWWLLPPLLFFLITLITPLFTDRYMIWTLPALVLLLAWGAVQIARQNRWIAAAVVLILVGFQAHQGWRQMTTPIKPDLRAAAAYVAPRRGADELTLFLMPYIQYTYRYYDPGEYPRAEAPYANREPDASQIPQHLSELTTGYRGVWLVESEADFYDRNGLIHAWLDENASLVDEAHFTRADVYHYILH
jgi:4-amino-4-deoxy-L-arabinose transferase-like glycosyltransferase